MKARFVALFVLCVLVGNVFGCAAQTTNPRETLAVYAAASLANAFQELATEFQAVNPNTKIEFNFAGSQELRTQIEQGARADVFASADLKTMDTLHAENLIDSTPRVFARNRLVVIVPKDNKAGLKELNDLSKAGIKLVIADESVPVGKYTLQMLDTLSADAAYGAGFKNAVLNNVVSQENNVRGVLSKVSLGEADAGVVYSTDAQAALDKLGRLDVPDAFNVIALYPMALVHNAHNAPLAEKWIAFVLSAQGQAVLNKYGFVPPSQ